MTAITRPRLAFLATLVSAATPAEGQTLLANSVIAGSTFNFQRWNRDPAAGGTSANFSDGLEVLMEP